MIKAVVLKILVPLAKVMFRFGVTYQMFSEWAKEAFVEAAKQMPSIQEKKQPNAAISILTGLHRKDVQRFMQYQNKTSDVELQLTNRLLRVVQGWVSDTKFSENGKAKILPFDGEGSFSELNRRYSGDMKPKAMLDDLVNNQMVQVDENKKITLISKEFMPKGDAGKLEILAFDASSLIQTIHRNIILDQQDSLFQKKVHYDNLPKEILPTFKELVNQKSLKLLIELNDFLKQYDSDTNGKSISEAQRSGAGLSIFYFDDQGGKDI